MSRDIQLGFAAADLACVDAGLRESPLDPERLGVMLGADMTVYLAEGDVRPYAGFGGMLLIFPYQGIGATIAPAMKAGLLVNLDGGFSGFAEIKHVFGLPFSVGAPSTAFKELTGFAFGLSFTPRFN